MFDSSGDRQGLTQIEQLQNGEEVRVGFYNPSSPNANKIIWSTQTRIQWQGQSVHLDLSVLPLRFSSHCSVTLATYGALESLRKQRYRKSNIHLRPHVSCALFTRQLNTFFDVADACEFNRRASEMHFLIQ